jgi:hypothetical protein
MTDPQASYLDTFGRGCRRGVPDAVSKAEASDLIDELQRGNDGDQAIRTVTRATLTEDAGTFAARGAGAFRGRPTPRPRPFPTGA